MKQRKGFREERHNHSNKSEHRQNCFLGNGKVRHKGPWRQDQGWARDELLLPTAPLAASLLGPLERRRNRAKICSKEEKGRRMCAQQTVHAGSFFKGFTCFLTLRTLQEVLEDQSAHSTLTSRAVLSCAHATKRAHRAIRVLLWWFLPQKSHQRRAGTAVGLPLHGLQCVNHLLSNILG